MDYSNNQFLTKKNIISLLILAIIMVSIPLGVRLAQNQQILKSQAAEEPILFSSSEGLPDSVKCTGQNCTTTSPIIDIKVESTLGEAVGVQRN